jgi:formate dehydrogenase subunit gamma
MFHPATSWLAMFGGGQWTRILHPFIGLVMFVSFACWWCASGTTTIDAADKQWLADG